ncbi:TIM barrel protein [Azorhizobium sp. AG788]|uniref:hydroxypyruvate isomerase family protein n=1 Tax=Azorhizobium sp. AG788 TaxID=2183897 RepID=UPI0031397BD8
MPRFAANLNSLFNEWAFLDRFAAAADAGFTAVEFQFPYAFSADAVAARLQRNGLKAVTFALPPGDWAAGDRGLAALPNRFDDFKVSVADGLSYARTIGAAKVQMMAGLGRLDDPQAVQSFRRALSHACEHLQPHGIELLIEPLDPREIPGYFLTDSCHEASLAADPAFPNLRLQFDIYQQQLARGDVAMALTRKIRHIGHVQVAGVPDRSEPDDGELNFPFLFAKLERLGYKGYVGCDYRPRGRCTVDGLGWFAPYSTRARVSA